MGQSLAIKVINILFYVLFAVSIVLGVLFFIGDKNADSAEPLLIGSYVLTIAAVGTVLVFMILGMFSSKKSAIMSLAVMGVFAILIGISYALASDVIPLDVAGEVIDESLTAAKSRWTGASLFMLYILLGISFVTLIYTEIKGALK